MNMSSRTKRYASAVFELVSERYGRLRRSRDYHFIIYASARSGSTSLRRAFDCYRGIHCAPGEPFNEVAPGNIRRKVSDLASLQLEVAWLWGRYNGFKHLWFPDRSKFGDPAMDDYILTSAADRVVLLSRRNVLQRIVSTHLSEQTGVWQVWKRDERDKLLAHRYQPLDRARVRKELGEAREAFAAAKKRLMGCGRPYVSVLYEDVFGAESVEQKISALGSLLAFVTGRPFQKKRLSRRVLAVLNPALTKLNSAATYERVPRIQEIEGEFGCEETGYLLR